MYIASGCCGARIVRLPIARDGFLLAMQLDQHVAAIDPCLDMTRIDLEHAVIIGQRVFRAADIAKLASAIVERFGMIRIDRKRLSVTDDRLSAFAESDQNVSALGPGIDALRIFFQHALASVSASAKWRCSMRMVMRLISACG